MKMAFSIGLLLTVSWSLCPDPAFAHSRPVHRKMTEKVTDFVFTSSSAYARFLQTVSSDILAEDASDRLSAGSDFEDRKIWEDFEGGWRQFNHFYDPLTGLGLSNIPHDEPRIANAPFGRSSFDWASEYNCPGTDVFFLGPFLLPIPNVNKRNVWSWQNAREHQWDGLTLTDPEQRHETLLNMYRALGQVVHLLQDASSPQHVRNEQHLPILKPIGIGWSSPIEIDEVADAHFRSGFLDWRSGGFTKMKDFWDRDIYNGQPEALNAEARPNGAKLGLAEYANGNFIGERHTYAEMMKGTRFEFDYRQSTAVPVNKPGYYPYPSRDTSTNYKKQKADPVAENFRLRNGQQRSGIYLKKISDGITLEHHSRMNYLGAKLKTDFPLDTNPFCTINDEQVVGDYHSKIIPKAIEYSAALLDYFFRGRLKIMVLPNVDNTYSITIKNLSGQKLKGGEFQLYWDNSSDSRARLTGTAFSIDWSSSHTLNDDSTITATFTPPTGATVKKYTLIYKGTIGAIGENADDPVDAGVAIAVKSFGTQMDWSNLQWDTSVDEYGIGTATVSGMGASFEGEADAPISEGSEFFGADDVSHAIFSGTGTMNYTGPEAECVVSIDETVSTGVYSGGFLSLFVLVDSDLLLEAYWPGDYTFTVPESIDAVVSVVILGDAASNWYEIGPPVSRYFPPSAPGGVEASIVFYPHRQE